MTTMLRRLALAGAFALGAGTGKAAKHGIHGTKLLIAKSGRATLRNLSDLGETVRPLQSRADG